MGTSAKDAVATYLDLYGASDSSLAWLLCDRYACDQVAYRIIDADLSTTEVTYGSLRDRSERFARALFLLGVEPGDRVATLMSKREEYLVTLLAIWRLGAVHVPLFTAFAPPAIASRLRRSGAKVVVTEIGQRQKLAGPDDNWGGITVTTSDGDAEAQPSADIDFDDCVRDQTVGFEAAVLGGKAPLIHTFTSGTTGEPKGVVVPTRALASFRVYAEYAIGLQHDDLYWNAADPGWAYGLFFGVLGSLLTGVPSVLARPGFSAPFTWSVLSALPITNFAAAPTVYRSLRAWHEPSKGSVSLRCASSAGEPLTPEVNEWAPSALGTRVYDHYGQTETGMLINNHHHAELEGDIVAQSMGIVMPGWDGEVLLRDADIPAPVGTVGRIAMRLARSPLAWFDGYDGEAEKSREKLSTDGLWYLTGDVGKRDEAGYFFFSCRDDDVIITAGYRIGSFEIESIIANHPAVAECAVIAVPDEIRGEVIEAYVTLRAGQYPAGELTEQLQDLVRSQYGSHAYPRAVHVVDELPKTPSGKMQRFVLRARRRAELAGQAAKP
ncbi:MAG TPA: AMP-binding protein [Acidimicrobiales bacterium]|nr:AMP-binding protein [Acidimicrobiales bacterium]